MKFSHDQGTIDLEVRLGAAPLSQKRNNVEPFILLVFAKGSSLLPFLLLDNVILNFRSRQIFTLFNTLANESCIVEIPKIVVCASARPSDLNKTTYKSIGCEAYRPVLRF